MQCAGLRRACAVSSAKNDLLLRASACCFPLAAASASNFGLFLSTFSCKSYVECAWYLTKFALKNNDSSVNSMFVTACAEVESLFHLTLVDAILDTQTDHSSEISTVTACNVWSIRTSGRDEMLTLKDFPKLLSAKACTAVKGRAEKARTPRTSGRALQVCLYLPRHLCKSLEKVPGGGKARVQALKSWTEEHRHDFLVSEHYKVLYRIWNCDVRWDCRKFFERFSSEQTCSHWHACRLDI